MKSAYDGRTIKYNKVAEAYVVTKRKPTRKIFGIYDVTLSIAGGIPHGFILGGYGKQFDSYLFAPGHSGSYYHGKLVGSSPTLAEAVMDVRKAWQALALPYG
jgi:hypothetical protein